MVCKCACLHSVMRTIDQALFGEIRIFNRHGQMGPEPLLQANLQPALSIPQFAFIFCKTSIE